MRTRFWDSFAHQQTQVQVQERQTLYYSNAVNEHPADFSNWLIIKHFFMGTADNGMTKDQKDMIFTSFASSRIKVLWRNVMDYLCHIWNVYRHGAVNRKWHAQHDCWGKRGGEGCGRDHMWAPIVQVIHGDAREQTWVWVTHSASSSFFVCMPLSVYVCKTVYDSVSVGNLWGIDYHQKGHIHTHTPTSRS